ncbi:MAG: DNA recombination protein RmuC, partial [Erysipelotrichaceae bacterium]|nr:DNA recombination protein RmuC [Erysipelotrichaceae bacterium]
DKEQLEKARKDYQAFLKSQAKSISEKYLKPPLTTPFAILYLPSESMYAEAINASANEEIHHKYHVIIAGPTTMAALLNSLLVGFKTLTVQKKSVELWNILNGVAEEFKKFENSLDKVHKQMRSAIEGIEDLQTTRTKKLGSQLEKAQKSMPVALLDPKDPE